MDIFAASAMSPYLLKCGGGQPCQEILKTMDSWSVSENLWLRRTAILCQMKLKSKTDLGRLILGFGKKCFSTALLVGFPFEFVEFGLVLLFEFLANPGRSLLSFFLKCNRLKWFDRTLL